MSVTFHNTSANAQLSDDAQTDSPLRMHVVQRGDSLEGIASHYDLAASDIKVTNALTGYDDITIGDRLLISGSASEQLPILSETLIVGFFDTLYSVAAENDVDAETLAKWNHIVAPDTLVVGQTLSLDHINQNTALVKFQQGESFLALSVLTDSSPLSFAQLNDLQNPIYVPPGKFLRLPDGSEESNTPYPDMEPLDWVHITPTTLVPGHIFSIVAESRETDRLEVAFMGTIYNAVAQDDRFEILIPISRWTASGVYPFELTLLSNDGTQYVLKRNVLVTNGSYAAEAIRLTPSVASVLEDTAMVNNEAVFIESAMSGYSDEQYWDGLFQIPTPGVLTSGFGTLRSYNGGGYNSYHAGADLAARAGTIVVAPADGMVSYTGLLAVRGWVTIIDHGQGVYTGYWHQSEVLVESGDLVTKGQTIGKVGNTGLSTAAHLHWEMQVHGVKVNPMQWTRIAFP